MKEIRIGAEIPEASHPEDPIAIVGAGCRLPGNISNLEDLFATLRRGRDCISEVPVDRWRAESYYDADPLTPGKTYVRYGGFVTGIDQFDAGFFGISDAEASRMDPQQRMALQTVWHALENAGQAAEELAGSNTGVFLAMMNTNGYAQLKGAAEGIAGVTGYDAVGDAMSIAAGRISHFLGLEGPCITVDTACSGSLVALHLARQSILAGECDAAIVAGVSVILTPDIHVAFSKLGLMSRSGRCKAFDESADGYVRGEGCMAVLLRRQSQGIARGDHILASIVGTAINQDGHTPALTAPNGRTQEQVIRLALARTGIHPHEVAYVEAHGTGTPVGDPIEMTALANVYGPGRSDGDPVYVGSVKSNFGHIESGAGLLGVVKAALSLDRGLIFRSLHFHRLNPNIHLGAAPLCVPTATVPWPRGEVRRVAGVNSFGYSGTNAHAVLQEAPVDMDRGAGAAGRPAELIVLSAKSAASLHELAGHWSDSLSRDTPTLLRDIAFTAVTGRTHLRHRLAFSARGKEEIREKLEAWREGRVPKGLAAGQAAARHQPKIAFIFTDQGAQYAEMGRQLDENEPRFAVAIDRCAALMDSELGMPLREVLFGRSSQALLEHTRYAQPALFAIEYALADLLVFWGVEPDFVMGHGAGEIAAACVAGMLTLDDAVRLILTRSRLMERLPRGGKMLDVEATPEEAQVSIRGKEADVALAAVRGPHHVVLSGKADAVDAIAQLAAMAGRRMEELDTPQAFHSPLVDPILADLRGESIRSAPPKVPLVSTMTGGLLDGAVADEYWSMQARQPVLFYQAIRRILDAGCEMLIEIGPHPVLTPSMSAALGDSRAQCVATLMRDRQDVSHLFETLGALYVAGAPVHLDRLFWCAGYHRVSLPLYPFRRDRHWLRTGESQSPTEAAAELHPLLGKVLATGPYRAVFEATFAPVSPWVDHRVLGNTVFPGTAYLEMAARGFAVHCGQSWVPVVMRDISFERPLFLAYGKTRKLNLTLEDSGVKGSGDFVFTVSSCDDTGTETYCRGRIAAASEQPEALSLDGLHSRQKTCMTAGQFYGELREKGLEYGAHFSTVREVWLGEPDSGDAIGRITAAPSTAIDAPHPFSVAVLLDGSVQVFSAGLRSFTTPYPGAFIPVSIQSVTLGRQLPLAVWSHVSVQPNADGRAAVAHVRVQNDSGEVLAEIQGLELHKKTHLVARTEPVDLVVAAKPPQNGGADSRSALIERLRMLPDSKRAAALAQWLASEIEQVMGQSEELDLHTIDPAISFVEIGLDSLSVTELQRRIQEKLEFRFQPMQGLDYQSLESLAEYLLSEVLIVDPSRETAESGAHA